ncbi:MAG: tetratricopeptide repeat protein, partial [Lacipirellulaceae bacterium]
MSEEKSESDASSTAPLEPIANVSDYEPDLADEPTAIAEEPTPALKEIATKDTNDEVVVSDQAAEQESAEAASEEAESEETASTEIQPSSFFGATPGYTKRDTLVEEWGVPVDGDTASNLLVYELKGFPRVTVRLKDDVVSRIRVQLSKPFVANSLIERLQLSSFDTYTRTNSRGDVTETVVPERGVTLNHELIRADDLAYSSEDQSVQEATGEYLVHGLVIETIQGEHFLSRAERRSPRDYDARVADLETALTYDSELAVAKLELSKIGFELGRPQLALELIEEALESNPESSEFQLQRARCLTTQAKYGEAVAACQKLLESTETPKLVRAQTLYQMGLLSALGSQEIAKQTVPLHNKAIELADELSISEDPAVASAAGKLLVDAHLAVANAISSGEWQDKEATVAQWIERASGLAEQQIETNVANLHLRLQVAVEALAAGAKLSPPIDPKLWVAEAEETAAKLNALNGDTSATEATNWQLGLAYYFATDIQHRRGKSASALRYGDLAESQLAELAESRSELPDTDFLVGRLYFQIGAVHAVHRSDHDIACKYYDKAGELLMQPCPVTALASPGRHGDALVSMGVSYWHVGQKTLAYDYTKNGVEIVSQGIKEGLLEGDASAVAEGNLAAMDRAMGKVEVIAPVTPTPQTQVAKKSNQRRTNSNSSKQRV